MRSLVILVVAIWGFSLVAARAQDAPAIENVISSQLQAFNDRDIETAWTFASPLIKGIFGNSENFGMMVERGYPMVWNNRDARFTELRQENGAWVQQVVIKDTAGEVFYLDYEMIETAEGWQINGVALIEPDLSA